MSSMMASAHHADGPRRLAAIDIGTNSVKLLVADVARGGIHEAIHDEQRTTGLGQGVEAGGSLLPAAIDRTAAAVAEFAGMGKMLGAEEIRLAGTSALRNTLDTNANDFVHKVRSDTGLLVRVLSAEQELGLARQATLAQFGSLDPLVVADIGGGSTEVTVWRDGAVAEARSFNTGARNLTEAMADATSGPEQPNARERVVWDRFSDFAAAEVWLDVRRARGDKLVLQGGTAYCAARLLAGDVEHGLHGRSFPSLALVLLIQQVRELGTGELEELLHFDPDRAPVLLAGLMISDFICGATYADRFTFSALSLRHGMVLAADWQTSAS